MADTEKTAGAGAELRPDGMPKGSPFTPGKSGNPDGVSKYQRALNKAIEAQETPERVCEVIAAMRTQALAGEKSSPAAAKVYLARTLGPERELGPDLADAPPEVLRWHAERN